MLHVGDFLLVGVQLRSAVAEGLLLEVVGISVHHRLYALDTIGLVRLHTDHEIASCEMGPSRSICRGGGEWFVEGVFSVRHLEVFLGGILRDASQKQRHGLGVTLGNKRVVLHTNTMPTISVSGRRLATAPVLLTRLQLFGSRKELKKRPKAL